MEKPVIAMINEAAMGAGLSLTAACDIRICGASAVFRQAYTSVGLTPDGAWSLFLPLLIGFGRTSDAREGINAILARRKPGFKGA
jgi:2-(1,2-epoxy-1,2-dihydrophenyl)acetyl-CoA isomerase